VGQKHYAKKKIVEYYKYALKTREVIKFLAPDGESCTQQLQKAYSDKTEHK
jgi:ABC-type lipopolysaccharide export system ATPase subunit